MIQATRTTRWYTDKQTCCTIWAFCTEPKKVNIVIIVMFMCLILYNCRYFHWHSLLWSPCNTAIKYLQDWKFLFCLELLLWWKINCTLYINGEIYCVFLKRVSVTHLLPFPFPLNQPRPCQLHPWQYNCWTMDRKLNFLQNDFLCKFHSYYFLIWLFSLLGQF